MAPPESPLDFLDVARAAAAVVALPATALVIVALLRSQARLLVAPPTGDRWHERETPQFGGIAIFFGILVGSACAVAAGATPANSDLAGILLGAAVLFAVGLADDAWSLPPLAKLGGQVCAAAVLFLSGVRVEIVSSDALALVIGLVWIVGITNAFNLLDNMDGLAGSLAAIACTFFAVDAVSEHYSRLVLVLALATGLACLAFLPFNFRRGRPAAVFMGDSGSQMLGFLLAAIGLASSWKGAGTTVATLLLPILILAVPILDTALVMVVRTLEGRPIYRGGRDHSGHRLVYHGLSEKRAVALLAAIAAALGATSLAYNVLDDAKITLLGVLVTFALLVQFAGFLSDVSRAPLPEQADAAFLRRTFALHRRRLVEVLIDAALITAAFGTSFSLVAGDGTAWQKHIFLISLSALLGARYALFLLFGLYRSVWRYASARDAFNILAAVVASEIAAASFVAATQDFGDFPRSIYVLDALLCAVLIGGSRFAERELFRMLGLLRDASDRERTLVIGAGRGGRSLARELHETPGQQVAGFVDDDRQLRRRRLQGVPVLGGTDEIESILRAAKPDAVVVTIPNAPRDRLDRVVQACATASIPCRIVRRETVLDSRALLDAVGE